MGYHSLKWQLGIINIDRRAVTKRVAPLLAIIRVLSLHVLSTFATLQEAYIARYALVDVYPLTFVVVVVSRTPAAFYGG
jgi:hypothetical protein